MDRPVPDPGAADAADTPDPEQADRLSRAARDVVHQPADPRLEKAFGHLGLFPDPPPDDVPSPAEPAPPERPARPARPAIVPGAAAPAAPPAVDFDVEALRGEVAALAAAVRGLDRRLGTVIGLLSLAVVGLGIVAVLVIVQG
jgi:hypothetical protein